MSTTFPLDWIKLPGWFIDRNPARTHLPSGLPFTWWKCSNKHGKNWKAGNTFGQRGENILLKNALVKLEMLFRWKVNRVHGFALTQFTKNISKLIRSEAHIRNLKCNSTGANELWICNRKGFPSLIWKWPNLIDGDLGINFHTLQAQC